MLILGIETSCDETSVALVEDGRQIHANLISSQIALHAEFGGVVPELASRAHIQQLVPMIDACMTECSLDWNSIDAIAVTQGPGLVGALLIGVETAKSLAFAKNKPLIPVNHIAGHLYSPFLESIQRDYQRIEIGNRKRGSVFSAEDVSIPLFENEPERPLEYPYLGLVVSGGHTSLVLVESPIDYKVVGETVDDAAGEAFDKFAKLLSLGYPGGPVIDRMASGGDAKRFSLPRPMLKRDNFDFSFSGLKTAAAKIALEHKELANDDSLLRDFCASFQEAIVEVLLCKARAALKFYSISNFAIAGGVACNSRLRAAVGEYLPHLHTVIPAPVLCTDNAAMIAGVAYQLRDRHATCNLSLNADANLSLSAE
jgi:N6-L-threonylcarbamoyladenine synthase